MSAPICYLNGRYLPVAKAQIPATDRGFLFGEGLFETWKTYKGRPFAVREHLARMAKSARALGIPFDPKEDWAGRTKTLARRNGLLGQGGAVRFTITRGHGPVTLIPAGVVQPTRLMLFRPLEPGLTEAREKGVRIHLMGFGSGVDPSFRKLKTLNYLPAVRGKIEARAAGAFESLYRLSDDTVLEGTTSNFFVVKNGTLFTTPVANGILPGVTRSLVIKLASRIATVKEQRIRVADILGADEVFVTSSTIEIVPATHADRRRIGVGKPGELTRELRVAYRKMVARRLKMKVEDLGV